MPANIALLAYGDGQQDFSDYTEALLRLEGLRVERHNLEGFEVGSLPNRIVIASDLPLTVAEAEQLRVHAEAGARLVFLAPNPHAAPPTWRSELNPGEQCGRAVEGRYLNDRPLLL